MKKLLYILAFALVASTSLYSCTEEVVKPKLDTINPQVGSGIKE
jgi:hypothetical protein